MSLENVIVIFGFISLICMVYRINLVLEQEFPADDALIRDPLAFAASETIDFDKFKENSWKGFEALWAVIRFRCFYKRFEPLISPRDAKIITFVISVFFIIIIVGAELVKADPKVNGIVGAITTTINVMWWVIIEYGKGLKKSVVKLRVT